MKTVLKASTILSWVNLIIWGFFIVSCILNALAFHSMAMLIFSFFFSAVILHSYAALQLHKSIRKPAIGLSSQTPAGIRFIGFIVLFIGVILLGDGIAVLQNPQDILKIVVAQMPEFKQFTISMIRAMGTVALVLGAALSLNVIFNFRLLRWYYLVQKSDIK